MTLDISANIETEIGAASLAVIDLFVVDFGNGYRRYWSTHEVDSTWFPSVEFLTNITPDEFEARVIKSGSRSWSLGAENDSLDIDVSDGDGALSEIAREIGMARFEGAKVYNWQLFPSIKEAYKGWEGTGLQPIWENYQISWEIEFGIANLRRRFGRKLVFTCPSIFGGPDCPYCPSEGRGLPDVSTQDDTPDESGFGVFACTAGSQSDTVVYSTGGFSGVVQPGWIAWNRTRNAFAVVSTIDSDTQCTVINVVAGEGGTANFIPTDEIGLGPAYTYCSKTPAACKSRGMFGPHDADETGVGDKRRYFSGNAASSKVTYSGRLPDNQDNDRFYRVTKNNKSLDGEIIPVVFGFYRLSDIPSLHYAPAGDFQHGLFLICEGEIKDVKVVDINGQPIDDGTPDKSNTYDMIQNDAFWRWGTWEPNGIEDSRAINERVGREIRRATGRRKSVGWRSGNTVIDTYGAGSGANRHGETIDAGHPWLVNSGKGDGISVSGSVFVRGRIQTDNDDTSALTGNFDIWGLMTKLPNGHPVLRDGLRFSFTSGTDLKYTSFPNPILAAYNLCIDPRWGASISEGRIDVSSVITESAYCEEIIPNVDVQSSELSGQISLSNYNVHEEVEYSDNWFFTESLIAADGAMNGRQINFTTATREWSAVIAGNRYFDAGQDRQFYGYVTGIHHLPSEYEDTYDAPAGVMIRLDQNFPSGKEGQPGDAFTITNQRTAARFKANGPLADDISVGEMLERVLENCNGTFRQSDGGQIEFIIRKALTAAELDTVASDYVFTDRGTARNIVRTSDGVSTLRIWQENNTEIANQFTVKFSDQQRDFLETNLTVYSEEAQQRRAILHGDLGDREVDNADVNLNLTTYIGQAVRLLALRARETFIQNLFCEFNTSLKLGYVIQPGDIIAVDSNQFSMYNLRLMDDDTVSEDGALFFRVLEKTMAEDYQITFKCKVHINSIYDDSARSFGEFFLTTGGGTEKALPAAFVEPSTASSTVLIDENGNLREYINVEITWPDIDPTGA